MDFMKFKFHSSIMLVCSILILKQSFNARKIVVDEGVISEMIICI